MLRWVSLRARRRDAAACQACVLGLGGRAARRGAAAARSWPEMVLSRSSSSAPALVGAAARGERRQQQPAQVGVDVEAVEPHVAVEQAREQVQRLVAARRAAVRRRRDALADRAGERPDERQLVVAARRGVLEQPRRPGSQRRTQLGALVGVR